MTSDQAAAKARIRRAILSRRGAVPVPLRHAAARQVARRAWRLPELARASRIALYLPVGAELDCTPILTGAWQRGRQVYLPVVAGGGLAFAPYAPDTWLAENRWGIPEPVVPTRLWKRARELEVILAPLAAFDEAGRRLGMGGGFYDRTLAFLSLRRCARRPHFIGLAYELQKVPVLPADRHDVRLDAVITECALHRPS
jgi:5-formyltetrahydrofolate cyclo-ligase